MGKNVPEPLQIGKIWRKDWHVCWCLNQAVWKITSSNWSNFPRFRGGNKKTIWKYHLVRMISVAYFSISTFCTFPPQKKDRGWSAPAPRFVPPNPTNIGSSKNLKKRKLLNSSFLALSFREFWGENRHFIIRATKDWDRWMHPANPFWVSTTPPCFHQATKNSGDSIGQRVKFSFSGGQNCTMHMEILQNCYSCLFHEVWSHQKKKYTIQWSLTFSS